MTAYELFYRDGVRATGVDRLIAESGVTKVTFYRHYPSKNDLIRAFLEYRHEQWLGWFGKALAGPGNDAYALVPTLTEWFEDKGYRGCAFINTVGELADELPEVVDMARRHKEDMTRVIFDLLPASLDRDGLSQTLAVAIDGAIVRAQYDATPLIATRALGRIVTALIP